KEGLKLWKMQGDGIRFLPAVYPPSGRGFASIIFFRIPEQIRDPRALFFRRNEGFTLHAEKTR
ncbi:MAG TPA: hypothetical protein VFU15_17415, partial [Bacteroidia bacterium]|nr:hypothetical protein [Bacteroidia bacterium]